MTALSPPNHRAGPVSLATRRRSTIAQTSRYLGALAVLATGIAHIEQYSVEHGYRMAIMVAIVVEVAATVLLVVFLLANGTGRQNIRTRLTPPNSARGLFSLARQAEMALAELYVRLTEIQAPHAYRMAADHSHRSVPERSTDHLRF
jgi:hypothetical protein